MTIASMCTLCYNISVLNGYNRYKSGLPLYDVIFAKGLPKVASLPVATSQLVRSRILNGSYDFDYIFFTESDQV